MIFQCFILLAFLAAGELAVNLTGIPVSSGIIGMLLLTASLKAGIVKESWVEKAADFLIGNLGLFFIPAGVGVMENFGLIREHATAIAASAIVSTIVIIGVTGHLHQAMRRRKPIWNGLFR